MRARLLGLLVLPLLLTGLPAPAPAEAAPAAAAAAPPAPVRRDVVVAGTPRPYLLARPGGTPRGAVLVLHAQNQTMGRAEQTYGLRHLPQRGQLVAYLGGYGGSWNSGGCCGRARAEGKDDVGYLKAVLADVQALMPAGAPVSLLGYSSGAMMAYTAVCHARLPLRLVVSVSGTRSAGCSAARLPYRFVELHGGRDTTIPLDPPARRSSVLGMTPIPTRPAVRTLVQASGCTRRVDGGVRRTDWGGCRGGGVVRLLVQPAVGHQYSDLRAPFVLTRALEEVGQL